MDSRTLKKLNDFKNKYFSPYYRADWNVIHLSGTSKKHQDMVYEICWYLYTNKIPFITEPILKSGYNPDIVVPIGLPKKIIEVRHSENEKLTKAKEIRIPEELLDDIIYVEADQYFTEKLIQ